MSAASSSTLTPAGFELKIAILEELAVNKSVEGWTGHGVQITRTTYDTAPYRDEIQTIGERHGCHTCVTNKRLASDADQTWIGDHIPPTDLNDRARRVLKTSTVTVLYPQCDVCASKQATLVKKLNFARNDEELLELVKHWKDGEQLLIFGGQPANRTYSSTSAGERVSQPERQIVQGLGKANGCHSCGKTDYPRSTYYADHIFPKEFCELWMETVFEALGIQDRYAKTFELRPQCPNCSEEQGASVAKITLAAMLFASQKGIPCSKGAFFDRGYFDNEAFLAGTSIARSARNEARDQRARRLSKVREAATSSEQNKRRKK